MGIRIVLVLAVLAGCAPRPRAAVSPPRPVTSGAPGAEPSPDAPSPAAAATPTTPAAPSRPEVGLAYGLSLLALDLTGWLFLGASDSAYIDDRIPLADRHDQPGLAWLGAAMLMFNGVVIHCVQGACKDGGKVSLGLRFGMPLLAATIAEKAKASREAILDAALITLVIGNAIDILATVAIPSLLAPPPGKPSTAGLIVIPADRGAVVGVGGRF